MVWPTGNVNLTNLDAGADSISAARTDLYDAVVKLNQMITNGPGTGTVTVYNDDNVRAYLPTHNANVAATYFVGDGRYISNLNLGNVTSTYGNANVAAYLPTYTGNISPNNITANNIVATNITSNGVFTVGPYIEKVYSIGNSGTSNITPTMSNGPIQKITATGNFSLNAPSGMSAGSSLVLIVRQDGTGNRVPTISASYKFAGGQKILSTAAYSIDIITIFYDGTDYLCNLIKAYS
jgi:hypothetical protein